jgi:hypothetical protein
MTVGSIGAHDGETLGSCIYLDFGAGLTCVNVTTFRWGNYSRFVAARSAGFKPRCASYIVGHSVFLDLEVPLLTAADAIVSYKKVVPGSSRSFGFVFAGLFLLLALSPIVLRHQEPRLWALGLSAIFLVVALFTPKLLQPFNRLWFGFGLVLHAIINPIIMALIFTITVIPTGLALRICGKDPLRLKRAPLLDSYWVRRNPPGPQTGSMSKQF